MNDPTCTVADTFGAMPIGTCGAPATNTVATKCPRGHVELTVMCADHATIYAEPDAEHLWCAACAEAGRPYGQIFDTDVQPLAAA